MIFSQELILTFYLEPKMKAFCADEVIFSLHSYRYSNSKIVKSG